MSGTARRANHQAGEDPVPVRRIKARGAGYVSVGRSAASHLRLIIAATVLGLVAGALYGLVRPPTYTAESRLIVGKSISIINEAATAGLPAAAAQFASDYARLAGTQAVGADVAKRLGLPSVDGSISGSPIPDSPIIRIDAASSSQAAAVALANAAAQAVIDQVDLINQTNQANLNQLAQTYQQLQFEILQENDTIGALQARLNAGDSAVQAELNKDKATLSEYNLEANAVAQQYDNQYSPVQSDAQVVTLMNAATATGSDKSHWLEIGVVAGLFGGLIVGIALAAFIDLRRPAPRPLAVRD